MSRKASDRASFVLRLAGRLLILAVVAALFVWGIMTTGITRIVSRIDERFWLAVALAQPVALAGISVMGMRLSELVRRPRIPFFQGIKAFALFAGLNLFLPARLAELVKATYVRDHAGVPLSQGLAGIFLGILLDLTIFSLLAIFCFTFIIGRAVGEETKTTFIVLALVSSALIVTSPLLLRIMATARVSRVVSRIPYFGGIVSRITDHARGQATPRRMAMFMAFSIVGWGCSYATALTVLTVLGQTDLGFFGALAVFFAMTAGALITVLPGGLGTSEAGVVLILMALGETFDTSLVTAIALRLGFALGPVVLASLIILHEPTGLRGLRDDLYRAAGEIRRYRQSKT